MNNKKSLIITLTIVLIVGLSIAAGTFAYFQWTSGAEGGTRVNVTIEMGGITMHIEPEQTEFVGLYPTSHCENNVRYGDALVTIVNNTGTLAIPSFKLKVRVTDKDGNGVPADALSHINYRVVPIETTKDAQGNPVKGEAGSYSCSSGPAGGDVAGDNSKLFYNGYDWCSDFKLNSVATDGSWTHIPQVNDMTCNNHFSYEIEYLPRQYYLSDSTGFGKTFSPGDVDGTTFRGEAYTTSYQYFRVYVWIDEGYTSTIVGNTVSDPLQNAKIEITWSEESIVQQVSGESNSTPTTLAAGLYDNDGNMVKTWSELLSNNDITVEDNVITDSNENLTGELVIPEGIIKIGNGSFTYGKITSVLVPASVTEIEDYAFWSCTLNTVIFAENSQLTNIGFAAFRTTNIVSIEVPVGVKNIGSTAFAGCGSLSSITFDANSQLESIGYSAFNATILTIIELPATVNSIGYSAFQDSDLSTIIFKGTVEQWEAITFGEDWNDGVPATKVVCSNGEVEL